MRYARHIALQGFGKEGQDRLTASRIVVVGAGGLGAPVLLYLAAAGVGRITLVDPDRVQLSNLQRQVLYTTEDVGKPKAEAAQARLRALNPEIEVRAHAVYFGENTAEELLFGADLVLDCTDSIATRYCINDACRAAGLPWIYGAIYGYEGQVALFNAPDAEGVVTDYRDLFPEISSAVPTCDQVGVLGVLPGTIGMFQANEAIKYLSGIGEGLRNRLLSIDLRDNSQHIWQLQARPRVAVPRAGYVEIAWGELKALQEETGAVVVDIREEGELPEVDFVHLPLSAGLPELEQAAVVLVCQHGVRSAYAAKLLVEKYGSSKKIYHLRGGIAEGYEEYIR
jgi:molybdopterin/thiamine biosynthesis adenylyltransferase/rhodanese-related sulfurtransferase